MKRVQQMRLKPDMTVKELTDEMLNAGVIGAGKVGKAVEIIAEMFSDQDYTNFISMSGPLVPSGMRTIFTDLIKRGHINAIITSGANLVHDLVEAMGKPHLIGDENADDEALQKIGINRIYDIFIESEVFIDLERYIGDILDELPEKKRVNTSIHCLLREIGFKLDDKESILYNASRKDVPIFSPGLLDSMLGIPFWMYSKRSKLVLNPVKDFDHLAEMIFDAKKTGAIILGGGLPKHHTQYMNTLREGLDTAVQISTARVEDGSLSGAPLKEAISWRKLKHNKASTVFGDVTIIFPLIVAAVLDKIRQKTSS